MFAVSVVQEKIKLIAETINKLQIQGYLLDQADAIEKRGNSFPLNAFQSILKQLQKLAPDLHRVHFLRYLNSLYYDDYPAALENLHCYFDYSFGRYEIAILCLGMMHLHFGHPKQALEVSIWRVVIVLLDDQ
ncbi:hypothetical protein LguiA_021770 [Lonicera macranthoides]